ncbi:MAG: hypothetical protein QOE66_2495 [Chloroflexota bacterium]|nr:hypothetical protein [Chloroflexota bacterium]
MGFSPEPDRAILIVMRYESASSRRMLWALNQLRGRKRPEAVAEPSRPRPASPLTSPPSPGPVDLPSSLPKCSLSDTFADIPPASSSEPPEPPAAPEPATSRPASSGPILAPVTESPALSLRFDAATATAETPAPLEAASERDGEPVRVAERHGEKPSCPPRTAQPGTSRLRRSHPLDRDSLRFLAPRPLALHC